MKNYQRYPNLWERYKAYVAWEWEVFDAICQLFRRDAIKRWWNARSTWRR
jgi:hypothetical protein